MKYSEKYPNPVSGKEIPEDGIVWAHNREHFCKGHGCRKRTRYRALEPHPGWYCSEECHRGTVVLQ